MTPKEKAKELLDKYKFIEIPHYSSIHEVKQCALILVDEIQEVLMTDELYNPGNLSFDRIDEYWEQVKQEIENL